MRSIMIAAVAALTFASAAQAAEPTHPTHFTHVYLHVRKAGGEQTDISAGKHCRDPKTGRSVSCVVKDNNGHPITDANGRVAADH